MCCWDEKTTSVSSGPLYSVWTRVPVSPMCHPNCQWEQNSRRPGAWHNLTGGQNIHVALTLCSQKTSQVTHISVHRPVELETNICED